MSIGRIANRVVATAGEAETVLDAARRMESTNVGCVLVVKDGKPVGILTDRDITTRVVAHDLDPSTTSIAEVMTPEPDCVDEAAPTCEAIERMASAGVRRLAVTANGGSLLAIVTMDDVVTSLIDQAREIERVLRRSEPEFAVRA